MFPLRARAVTRPQHWLEWFLVSEQQLQLTSYCWSQRVFKMQRYCLLDLTCGSGSQEAVMGHRHGTSGEDRVCVSQCRHADMQFWCSFWSSGLSIKTQQPFSSGVIKPHGWRNRWSVYAVLAYHLPITQAIMGPSSFLFFLMTGSYRPLPRRFY